MYKVKTATAGYCSKEFAADYTGMSQKLIARRIRDGSIPSFKVAKTGTVRIRIEDLDAMMVPVKV